MIFHELHIHHHIEPCINFGLYCNASARCADWTSSIPVRSAIIRASFRMWWFALADKLTWLIVAPINAFINIIFGLITYCHQPKKPSLNLFSAHGLDIIHIKLKRPNKGRFYKKILPVNSWITMEQAVCPQGNLFRTAPFPENRGKYSTNGNFFKNFS